MINNLYNHSQVTQEEIAGVARGLCSGLSTEGESPKEAK